MGMPAVYYTADMVRAIPEDRNKYELVYGELLVTPSPRVWHEVVQLRLWAALNSYVERECIGQAFCAHGDISWDEDVLVSPDVFIVPLEEARTLDWRQMQHLLLIAEVLSPSSARYDRFTKRRRYQEAGVPLYWIIDADERQVEVWMPADTFPVFEREQLVWQPAGARAPLTMRLADLFRPV